jgi:hypothetical protein
MGDADFEQLAVRLHGLHGTESVVRLTLPFFRHIAWSDERDVRCKKR